MLISLGHSNCLDYGYSFFKVAIKAVNALFKRLVQSQAIAIGLAFNGKEEDWKKFMEEN